MADFVAVIRRAVDGLSDNTPEMRTKVYEKARSAVLRQLENMKPRPPEEMLRRQLDKLEAAILEVESEHAEALPALEDDPAAADAVLADLPQDAQPAPEPVPAVMPPEPPVATPAPSVGVYEPAPVASFEPAHAPAPAMVPEVAAEPPRPVSALDAWTPEPLPEPAPAPAAWTPEPAPALVVAPAPPAASAFPALHDFGDVIETGPAEAPAPEPAFAAPAQPVYAPVAPEPVAVPEPQALEPVAPAPVSHEFVSPEPVSPEPFAYEPLSWEPAAPAPAADEPAPVGLPRAEPLFVEPVAPTPAYAPEPPAAEPFVAHEAPAEPRHDPEPWSAVPASETDWSPSVAVEPSAVDPWAPGVDGPHAAEPVSVAPASGFDAYRADPWAAPAEPAAVEMLPAASDVDDTPLAAAPDVVVDDGQQYYSDIGRVEELRGSSEPVVDDQRPHAMGLWPGEDDYRAVAEQAEAVRLEAEGERAALIAADVAPQAEGVGAVYDDGFGLEPVAAPIPYDGPIEPDVPAFDTVAPAAVSKPEPPASVSTWSEPAAVAAPYWPASPLDPEEPPRAPLAPVAADEGRWLTSADMPGELPGDLPSDRPSDLRGDRPEAVHPAPASDWGFDDQLAAADLSRVPQQPVASAPEPVSAPAPAAASAPDWDSPFTDVPLPERGAEPAAAAAAPARKDVFSDDWSDLDSFMDAPAARAPSAPAEAGSGAETAPRSQNKVIRVEPRRRIDFTSLGLGLLGLLIVAGAGYGAWTFRDQLGGLVTGLIGTPPEQAAKAPAKTEPTAAPTPEPAKTPATETAKTAPAAEPAKPQDQAALAPAEDPNLVNDKFTQRLQEDGSEVDDGAGTAAASAEGGQSIAQQNIAAPDMPPPAGGTTPAPAAPAATQSPAPIGGGQKMYVYEERIGQSAPTAIAGAVTWSITRDPDANGKPDPVIQGQMSVPERGLTAMMTIKRNSDPSLPASHLIEIVFQLPKDFEGGGIDSVQRVAMKQTEQDRGNPLIAVPAKITDDFHMIALNDYSEARKTNLDLLRTRNWIDIPVTYRNGRRALLTMEKGSTGTEAFNTAIKEWEALGAATPQP